MMYFWADDLTLTGIRKSKRQCEYDQLKFIVKK